MRRRAPLALLVGTVAATLLLPATSSADVDLLNEANVRIAGATNEDQPGFVAGAGDVNADGFDDVVVGVSKAGHNDRPKSGSTYVIYGSASRRSVELNGLSSGEGFRIDGAAAFDSIGRSIDGAGDVNGDGYDDVIVGSPHGNNGRPAAGSSYVIYGAATQANVDLAALSDAQGFRIDGAAEGDNAWQVAGAGDVNGDGYDDVIVGAVRAEPNGFYSGASYVIYGAATQSSVDLAALTPNRGFRIEGALAADGSGYSVDGAGDVNDDGLDDVIIGAVMASYNDRQNSGSSYVIYGAATQTTIELGDLSASEGFRIDGAAAEDRSGEVVAGAGDVNGDGHDDLLVGASWAANNGRPYSGSSYVVYGGAIATTIDLNGLPPAQGFRIDGAAVDDYSGSALSGAGDTNGDGLDDVVIGAFGAGNDERPDSGASYVIYGAVDRRTIDLDALTPRKGYRILGASEVDRSGSSVDGAGDFNGDGLDDVVIGSPYSAGSSGTGQEFPVSSYVVFGAAPVPDETAPDTRITRVTAIVNRPEGRTRKARVKFHFLADEPRVTYECRLDGGGLNADTTRFSPCPKPKRYRKLGSGRYRFAVRAVDAAGNVDRSPASYRFRVVRRDGELKFVGPKERNGP